MVNALPTFDVAYRHEKGGGRRDDRGICHRDCWSGGEAEGDIDDEDSGELAVQAVNAASGRPARDEQSGVASRGPPQGLS